MIVREPEMTFEPAPAGLHPAACVDVVDLGEVETPWGSQRRIRLVWQLPTINSAGYPHRVSKLYKPSLHPKASLRKDLIAWQGRELSKDELQGFNTDQLVGRGCQIMVTHRDSNDGRTWANVTSIVPLPAGQEPPDAGDYVRVKDRPAEDGGDSWGGSDDEPPPF